VKVDVVPVVVEAVSIGAAVVPVTVGAMGPVPPVTAAVQFSTVPPVVAEIVSFLALGTTNLISTPAVAGSVRLEITLSNAPAKVISLPAPELLQSVKMRPQLRKFYLLRQ